MMWLSSKIIEWGGNTLPGAHAPLIIIECRYGSGTWGVTKNVCIVSDVHDDENDAGNSKHMRLVVITFTVFETRAALIETQYFAFWGTPFPQSTLRASFPARARHLRSNS